MPCQGCMKARRAIINRTPKSIRAPLARAFLPPDPAPAPLPLVTTAAQVVREARTWVGVPFLHQGRSRNGVDCVGLPIVVLHDARRLPPTLKLRDYPRAALPTGNLEQHFLALLHPAARRTCPAVSLRFKWQRTLAHVAIYTDTDTLIHALETHGRVIEHGFRGMWRTPLRAGRLGAAGGALWLNRPCRAPHRRLRYFFGPCGALSAASSATSCFPPKARQRTAPQRTQRPALDRRCADPDRLWHRRACRQRDLERRADRNKTRGRAGRQVRHRRAERHIYTYSVDVAIGICEGADQRHPAHLGRCGSDLRRER